MMRLSCLEQKSVRTKGMTRFPVTVRSRAMGTGGQLPCALSNRSQEGSLGQPLGKSRGAECAVGASEEGEVPEYSGRFPRTPPWVCRAPAVNAAVHAAAFRRGTPGCATAALPPSSPAPRQYARELVTTGGVYLRCEGPCVSWRNKAGEASILRGLRGKVLGTSP